MTRYQRVELSRKTYEITWRDDKAYVSLLTKKGPRFMDGKRHPHLVSRVVLAALRDDLQDRNPLR